MAGPNVLAYSVVATKMASGNVQYQIFQSLDGLNPFGQLRFVFVQPAADVTNVNTNVNGGAAGAARTFTYAENLSTLQGDFCAPDASGVPRLGALQVSV